MVFTAISVYQVFYKGNTKMVLYTRLPSISQYRSMKLHPTKRHLSCWCSGNGLYSSKTHFLTWSSSRPAQVIVSIMINQNFTYPKCVWELALFFIYLIFLFLFSEKSITKVQDCHTPRDQSQFKVYLKRQWHMMKKDYRNKVGAIYSISTFSNILTT